MEQTHPAAIGHLPPFITGPGQTDYLFVGMVVLVLVIILAVGNLYLRIHALPEHVAHRGNKIQLQIVSLLALLALFTHNHLFWVAALLLAFVQLPDFSTPIVSMAQSLEKLARHQVRNADGLERAHVRDALDFDGPGEGPQAGLDAKVQDPVPESTPRVEKQQRQA